MKRYDLIDIGAELLETAKEIGVDVKLNATVIGLYPLKEVVITYMGQVIHYKVDTIIVTTGVSDNPVVILQRCP